MLLLAHRGLVAPGRPENTPASVAAAVEAGADGCEVDLRLAADGVLVASHDDDLLRVAGVPLSVAGTPSAVLRGLRLPGGHRLARLPELVEAAQGRRTVLELKRGGAPRLTALALAGELRSLRRAGHDLDLTVSSFSPELVGAVRDLGLPVRTALLGAPGVPAGPLVLQAALAGHDEVHPHVRSTSATAVGLGHAAGLAVVPWTVNGAGDVRRLERAGADAVISDDTALLRAALDRAPVLVAS